MNRPKVACFTLDLEPDLYTKNVHQILLNDDCFRQIESFFLRNQLKTTVFVVANMLEAGLPIREKFSNIEAEFELHSYSHDLNNPDSEEEILRAKQAYLDYFEEAPRGYRAPNGDISLSGLQVLSREGFLYDASVFPSWRPELGYNYMKLPIRPWVYAEFPQLVELPFAAFPISRAVLSFSFLKLYGFKAVRLLASIFGLPDFLVFDSHLHDFIPPDSIWRLPRSDWRRFALLRNQASAFQLLQGFVDFLGSLGFCFVFMSDLYQRVSQHEINLPTVEAAMLRNGFRPLSDRPAERQEWR